MKELEELKQTCEDIQQWNKRITAEGNAHRTRINNKKDLVKKKQIDYLMKHDGEIISLLERAKKAGTPFKSDWNTEAKLYSPLLKVFSQFVCSQTKVVLDPKEDKAFGAGVRYSRGQPKVTVGNFGYGLRHNVNSQKIGSPSEVRYILQNHKEICKNLRKIKLANQAEMIEELMEKLPILSEHGSQGVAVELDEPVEIIGNNFEVDKVNQIKFSDTWDTQVITLVGGKSGAISMNPRKSIVGFYAFMQIGGEAVERYLRKAEEIGNSVKSPEEISEIVKEVVGRRLLLSDL